VRPYPRHRRFPRLSGWLLAATLVAACATALLATPTAPKASTLLPAAAEDLQRDGSEAAAKNAVLVLEFWAEDCPYCRRLDDEVLVPLLKSGETEGRMVLRRVDIHSPGLRDFAGRSVTGQEIADRYNVDVTPTLVLLAPDGRDLGERMIGINSVDYYGVYLDAALERARERLSARP